MTIFSSMIAGINLLRAPASGCIPIVVVDRYQIAYRQYTTFLPAYISAMNKGIKVRVDQPNHPINYSGPLVTNDYPPLSISFPKTLPSEASDMLKGVGYYETKVKGTTLFIINEPTLDLVQRISKMGVITTCPAPVNTVNFACLYSLRTIRSIFSAFFRLHAYPAFIDKEHAQLTAWMGLDEGSDKKRKRDDGDDPKRKSKKPTIDTEESEGEGESDDEEMAQDGIPKMSESIKWALPAPGIKGWAEDERIPEGTGVFVQFVSDLASTDGEKAVVTTIRSSFLGCLGSTTHEIIAGMDRIQTAMGIISKTEVGKALNHMAWCIDAGLQAQARILPILSKGAYHGCLLLGWGFTIKLKTGDFVPVENQKLVRQIEDSSPFGATLLAISAIVSGGDASSPIIAEILGCSTSIQLRKLLLPAHLSESDRTTITTLCSKLRFSKTPHFGINPTMLNRALHLIANPDDDLPDDYPLLPQCIFESDRVILVLSGFGVMVPTFRFAGGPKYDLESSKCLVGHLGVRTVPLREAANDMHRIISEKSFIGTTSNRRSAVFKDRIFTGLDSKSIVESLRSICGILVAGNKNAKEAAAISGGDTNVFDQF
jgi:hypothetical protein